MNRRTVLSAVGAAAIAGCTGSSDAPSDGAGGSDDDSTPTGTPTPTPTPTPGPGNYDADGVKSEAQTVPYDDLFRNIEQYTGESVYFEFGQVYQTMYEDEFIYVQMYVSNDDQQWEGDVAAEYYGDERILENDQMECWAIVEDLYTYTTVQGNDRTIPYLTLVDYELHEE